MPRIRPGPPCTICGKPSHAKSLCTTHYTRWIVHGRLDQGRPDDWGTRSAHPLKDTWCHLLKCKEGRVSEWDNFWTFVSDVGDRPDRARLKRHDKTKPWSADNAYWQQFYTTAGEGREGRNAQARAYRKQNPVQHKAYDLKKKYGITLEQYDRMLEEQNGGCAICGERDGTFGRLVVDHCHETKRIRGLLCSLCNRAIGGLRHDLVIMRNAVAYVERSR